MKTDLETYTKKELIALIKAKEKTALSLGAKLDEYHKMNAGFQEEYQSLKDENT